MTSIILYIKASISQLRNIDIIFSYINVNIHKL